MGTSAETVTVEANPIAVQSDSGELSNVITDKQVSQLAVKRPQYLSACSVNARGLESNQRLS